MLGTHLESNLTIQKLSVNIKVFKIGNFLFERHDGGWKCENLPWQEQCACCHLHSKVCREPEKEIYIQLAELKVTFNFEAKFKHILEETPFQLFCLSLPTLTNLDSTFSKNNWICKLRLNFWHIRNCVLNWLPQQSVPENHF